MSSTPVPVVRSMVKAVEPLDGHAVALFFFHAADSNLGTQVHMSREEARQLIELIQKQLDSTKAH